MQKSTLLHIGHHLRKLTHLPETAAYITMYATMKLTVTILSSFFIIATASKSHQSEVTTSAQPNNNIILSPRDDSPWNLSCTWGGKFLPDSNKKSFVSCKHTFWQGDTGYMS
jgi:hypothetical protein